MKQRNRILLTILLVSLPLCSSFCIDMYLPAFSAIAKVFNIKPGLVNLSMSVYLAGLAIGQLFFGLLADKYGRRSVLIVGLTTFVLGSLFCNIAQSFPAFLVARVIQALGACSSIVLSRVIVADLFGFAMRTRMLGLISAVNIVSPGVAPLLGGYFLKYFDWQSIFLFITCFGLMQLFFTITFLPETIQAKNPKALNLDCIKQNMKSLVSNRTYLGYLLGVAMMYGTIFVRVTYSPDILIKQLHISPSFFGLYFIIPALGSCMGALLIVRLANLLPVKKGILICYGIILTGVALLVSEHLISSQYHLVSVVLPIFIIFLGSGMVQPMQVNCAISQFLYMSGFATGFLGFSQGITGGIVGFVTGMFYVDGIKGLTVIMCISSGLAITGFLFANNFFNVFKLKNRADEVV